MTEYPIYETVTVTLEQKQNEWIIEQARKRLLNKSIIIREAIELLKKEYTIVDGLVMSHLARADKLTEYLEHPDNSSG